MRIKSAVLLAILSCLAANGCGLKGPLKRPQPPDTSHPQTQPSATQPAPNTDSK